MTKIGFIRFGVFLNFITVVISNGRFEIKLLSLSNPSGKEADGDPCDSIFSFGGSDCDPAVLTCIDEKCEWTQEYENQNSLTFGDILNQGVTNPLWKDYIPRWPGSATVSMFIEDVDDELNHDVIGHTKLKRFNGAADKNTASSSWKPFDFTWYNHGGIVIVRALARVYCRPYFFGSDCSTVCFPSNHPDRGYYTCDSDTGEKICHANYYGPECKSYCLPRDDDLGHYICGKEGQKICLNGWQGDNCAHDVDECVTESPCSPYGNCTNLLGTYECACRPEYTGKNCDEVKKFCYENPCGNHSKECHDTFGGYECICEDFWRGRHCDEPPYCHNSSCSNTSVCRDKADGYTCLCQEGWQGRYCTERITPCTSTPCLHNGVCSVVEDDYNCTCVGEWEGPECQHEIKEVFYDNRTVFLQGHLTAVEESDFKNYIKELLVDIGFPNCSVKTDSVFDDDYGKTTVVITVSSHDHRIVGTLRDIPIHVLVGNLTLYQFTTPSSTHYSTQTSTHSRIKTSTDAGIKAVTQPIVATKTGSWVKEHWYLVLVVSLVLACALAVSVFFIKKRRLHKLKQSDYCTPVYTVNGAKRDIAIGFDNTMYYDENVYYEINNQDSVKGPQTVKSYDTEA